MSIFSMAPSSRPIGVVEWGRTRAELRGRNVWRVTTGGRPDPTTERNLVAIYDDRLVYQGPSDGHYGPLVLRDLAARMGGVYSFNRPGPLPKGAVS